MGCIFTYNKNEKTMADWHNNQYSTIHSLGFFEEIKGRIEENHNDFLNSQQQKCMNKGEKVDVMFSNLPCQRKY